MAKKHIIKRVNWKKMAQERNDRVVELKSDIEWERSCKEATRVEREEYKDKFRNMDCRNTELLERLEAERTEASQRARADGKMQDQLAKDRDFYKGVLKAMVKLGEEPKEDCIRNHYNREESLPPISSANRPINISNQL